MSLDVFWLIIILLLLIPALYNLKNHKLKKQLFFIILVIFGSSTYTYHKISFIKKGIDNFSNNTANSHEGIIKKYRNNIVTIRTKETNNQKKPNSVLVEGYWHSNKKIYPGDFVKVNLSNKKAVFHKFKHSLIKAKITKLKTLRRSNFLFIHKLKENVIKRTRNYLPKFYADFLIGLLFGLNGIKLDNELFNLFKDLGLLHAIVVSGAQVMLLTSILIQILRQLRLPNKAIFTMVLIFNSGFLLFVGGDVSVLRAVIMLCTSLLLSFDFRVKNSLSILFLTGLLLLIINPFYLFSLSFILSFAATYSIIDISPRIKKWLENKKTPDYIDSPLSVSISPFIIISPILALIFHRIDYLSLPANILLGPLFEALLIIGFFCILCSFISPFFVANLLFKIPLGIMSLMLWLAGLIHKLPHTLYFNKVNITIILLYVFILITIFYIPGKYKKQIKTALFVFTCSTLLTIYIEQKNELILLSVIKNKIFFIYSSNNDQTFFYTDEKNSKKISWFLSKAGIHNISILAIPYDCKIIKKISNTSIKKIISIKDKNAISIKTKDSIFKLSNKAIEVSSEDNWFLLSLKNNTNYNLQQTHGCIAKINKNSIFLSSSKNRTYKAEENQLVVIKKQKDKIYISTKSIALK